MASKSQDQEQDLRFRSLSPEQKEQLMVQAAKLSYDLDMSMSDIGKEIGLTRWQVGRLLKDARELGIVRIDIVPTVQRLPELEVRLQQKFGLREAIVVSNNGDDLAIAVDRATQVVGSYLAAMSPRPSLVGVSWGRTMAAVARWLPRRWTDGVDVVLLNGATTLHSTPSRTNNIAELFAQAGNGRATLLPVPAIVGRATTRQVLEQDPVIAHALEMADRAPVALYSVGEMSANSVLVQSGYLGESDVAELTRRGAVGDILGRFVDANGHVTDAELDARTIGLHPERLKEKAFSICVGVGAAKHAVMHAVLKSRFANVCVTDEQTAHYALEAKT
ncbi:Transcriptional regulator with sigma factor-related N-terminal domain containing protein [uncultured Pleomorphomonas sp.]|uniref:Transcriptional regulator with sigma factor-related N-terminal domain containing protein n=1 Tax=uncultured Pleomorphomonas sp. TaxID=442121 RepID=A0A212LMR4_9HYPH|nr:sugar-binding transcriptional regulator [uncultured Pleomorphomonas sp.]SCM78800.1 Transcriptional regulator with sigma factor-related N-terminal domain containing protein [uncultured Pleomorphomonas sp.]